MKSCLRHKWRVGSGIAQLIKGKLLTTKLNIWCERCKNVIKANYFSDYELEWKKKNKKLKKRNQK